jgi:cysteinyl-tRNA synthetase
MSKSLGNFFTIQEIFEKSSYDPITTALSLRYLLLLTHYRSPIEFSKEQLDAATAGVERFKILLQRLEEIMQGKTTVTKSETEYLDSCQEKFETAMDDDFNTPQALATLHELATRVNANMDEGISPTSAKQYHDVILNYLRTLGLDLIESDQERESIPLEIEQMVEGRNEARSRKDWKRADQIRGQLEEKGYILEDRPDGTTRVRRS